MNHAIDIGIIDRYSNQGLEIILESCVFLVFNLCEIVLLAIEEEEEEEEGQLWLKMVARDPINRTCPCNSLVREGFDFFFFYAHQDFWPSSRGKVSLPLSPGFDPQRACLSLSRCLTCLLGLQGVQ